MGIVVIHGPQASGKTFHAEVLRQHYGCTGICDGYIEGAGGDRPREGDLLLTYLSPEQVMRHRNARGVFTNGATFVPIEAARRAINVGPVRPLAEWRAV